MDLEKHGITITTDVPKIRIDEHGNTCSGELIGEKLDLKLMEISDMLSIPVDVIKDWERRGIKIPSPERLTWLITKCLNDE